MTRITEDRPAIAPSLMRVDIQPSPARSAATAIGSGTLSSLYEITPVAIPETRMYSTVQMSSEPMMPTGMSFCGVLASCAAVLTASNPMYAKNTMPAPVITPVQPNSPRVPVFGDMKGCQFAGLMACAAPTMNNSTTATLTNTMTLLTLADSLMPTTSSVVTIAMMITAGRLKTAVTCGRVFGSIPRVDRLCSSASVIAFHPPSGTWMSGVPRAAASAPGTSSPTSCRNDTT